MDLQREHGTIGPKMLAKELRDLEINDPIAKERKPVTVEYYLKGLGRTLESVIDPTAKWGMDYRDRVIGKTKYKE